MKLLFTKSSAPLSILIRKGLNEPVSHFAIVFDDNFVVHSNLYGVNLKWFKTFKKHCDVVFELDYKLNASEEELIYQNIMNNLDEAPYDYTAFLYFTWRAFLFRAFKIAMPAKNILGNKNSFLCTELASQLPDSIYKKEEDLAITSPYKLYLKLTNKESI